MVSSTHDSPDVHQVPPEPYHSFKSGGNFQEHDHELLASLRDWPLGPRQLVRGRGERFRLHLYDFVLGLIPLLLIVKVGLCVLAYGQDVGHTGIYGVEEVGQLTRTLVKLNSQLTTLFTIVFVAVVSNFVRRWALWRAQEGATIGELEQFQSSTSLPSTVLTAVTLRNFSVASCSLTLLWCLYYLGSQASQREYTYQTIDSVGDVPIALPLQQLVSIFQYGAEVDYGQVLTYVNSIYLTALAQKATSIPNGYDTFGFPLTPWFGVDADGNTTSESDKWHNVSKPQLQSYVSFVGWPIYTYNSHGALPNLAINVIGDYTYNTSHLEARCEPPLLRHDFETWQSVLQYKTRINISESQSWSDNPSVDVLSRYDGIGDMISPQPNYTVHTTCTIAVKYVELQGHCAGTTCQAQRLRPMLRPLQGNNDSILSNVTNTKRLLNSVQNLLGPSTGYGDDSVLGASGIDLGTAYKTGEVFTLVSRPLTQLLNSYYTLSGNAYVPGYYGFINSHSQSVNFTDSTLRGSSYNPHYQISITWCCIDAVSCTVLLFLAIVAHILRRRTIAPDIFGFVSTMTRDNANVSLPPGGSGLDGLERSRILRNTKVRLADISDTTGKAVVGHVGLMAVTSYHAKTEKMLQEKGYYF